MENKRVINPEISVEDINSELSLRPKKFSDYVGQQRIKETLSISIKAANTILIKPNQIGTLTETIEVINLAHENKYNTIELQYK